MPLKKETSIGRKERCNNNWHVVYVCSEYGFPHGLATTDRMTMIGRAIISCGLRFSILHIGGSDTISNKQKKGVHEEIVFEYFPGILYKPENAFRRSAMNLYGIVLAILRVREIWSRERKVCVLVPSGGTLFIWPFKLLLWITRVPSIQLVDEWWPGTLHWFRQCLGLYLSDGTIAISRSIEDRLHFLCKKLGIRNKIIRIPILIDAEKWEDMKSRRENPEGGFPYISWCGDLRAMNRDVLFLLRILCNLSKRGFKCKIALIGPISASVGKEIEDYIEGLGLQKDSVCTTGYVTDKKLFQIESNAIGLLLPLWDDNRSRCRFPTKLGHYLLSRRPVITCKIGDLGNYLVDGFSAYFCKPGDENDFTDKIRMLLADPIKAAAVGENGRIEALKWFAYRRYSKNLADFAMRNARP